MKAERIGQVLREVSPVMSARIQMKFMRDSARVERLVQGLSACLKSIIILSTAIKIDFHASEMCPASERERIIAVPKLLVGRGAENISQQSQAARLGRTIHGNRRQSLHQRTALC